MAREKRKVRQVCEIVWKHKKMNEMNAEAGDQEGGRTGRDRRTACSIYAYSISCSCSCSYTFFLSTLYTHICNISMKCDRWPILSSFFLWRARGKLRKCGWQRSHLVRPHSFSGSAECKWEKIGCRSKHGSFVWHLMRASLAETSWRHSYCFESSKLEQREAERKARNQWSQKWIVQETWTNQLWIRVRAKSVERNEAKERAVFGTIESESYLSIILLINHSVRFVRNDEFAQSMKPKILRNKICILNNLTSNNYKHV